MNSLLELNGYSSTEIEVNDQRLANVLFDRSSWFSQIVNIDSTTFIPSASINITEVINYSLANCRYQVSIKSSINPTFYLNSSLNFGTLPSGVTLTSSLGVYTLTGINSKIIWDAIKNPTWTLPSDYATNNNFYLECKIIWYNEATGSETSIDWDVFDPRYYFLAELSSSTALTNTTNNILRTNASISSSFTIIAETRDLILSGIEISAAFTITASLENRSAEADLIVQSTMSASGDTIIGQFVAISESVSSPYLNIFYNNGTTFTRIQNISSTQPVFCQAWNQDGRTLVVGNTITTNTVLDYYNRGGFTFTKTATFNLSETAIDVDFAPDNITVAAVGNNDSPRIITRNPNNTFTEATVVNPRSRAYSVAWSPNGNIVALGSEGQGFNSNSGQYVPSLEFYYKSGSTYTKMFAPFGDKNPVLSTQFQQARSVSWHPNNTTIACAQGNSLYIFNFANNIWNQFAQINLGAAARAVSFSNNGNYLAVSFESSNGFRVYFRGETAYSLLTIATMPSLGFATSIDWRSDDQIIALGGTTSPHVNYYQVTGSGLSTSITKLPDPTSDVTDGVVRSIRYRK